MSSTKATSQEQPGIVAGLSVFVGCAVISCIAWYPLGGPVYAIALAFRGFGCANVAPGSLQMFFCSAGVALLQLLPAAIALVLVFVFRKPLMRWVQQGITTKLSPGMQFLVAPAVATCLFVIVWAGVHYTLPIQTGLLPQIIFPAVIGLFTFIIVRYGDGLRRALDPFFESRDRFPRWLRFVAVLAVPLLISVLITQPWREIVAAGPQLEHFIVLVALVVAFLLLAPRGGELAPVAVRSGGRGGAQARGQRGGVVRLVLKGSGYVVCRLALALGMAAALHAVLDLCTPELALAHDCTPDRPWDCQNTGGFNTTTATGSGVAGAGAVAGGTAAVTSGDGKTRGEGQPPVVDGSSLDGGPDDNPFTEFDGGDGAGKCVPPIGLPNYWVNTATLSLVVQDTFFAYKGLGPAVAFTLSYNSGSANRGMFGLGWAFSYESSIERVGGDIFLWKGSGQRLTYRLSSRAKGGTPDEPVEAVSVQGKHDRLLDCGRYWLFIEKDTRLTYRYDRSREAKTAWLTEVTDTNGNTVRVEYSADGTIEAITDAEGRSTVFACDGEGHCVSLTLPDGRSAAFSYDSQGNLVHTEDLLGIPCAYEYDADQRMTRMVVGHDRRTTAFTYRGRGRPGRIATVGDATGNTTSYELVSNEPRQVRVVNPEGRATTYHSTNGLTQRVVDPLGHAAVYAYDRGFRVSVRNKSGHTFRMAYDARGNMTKLTDPLGNSITMAYDYDDNLVSEISPLGEETRYAYDARCNLTRITCPMGRSTAMEYDPRGQLDAILHGDGNRTAFSYDSFGNRIATTGPLGNTERRSYDRYGLNLTAITDPLGNTTEYEYDANSRLTKVTHPDGTTNEYLYDCCAGTSTTDENGRELTFSRDPLRRVMERADAMGNRTRFGYDRSGRLVETTDALGRACTFGYDGAGRAIHRTNPLGRDIQVVLDPEDNVVRLWDEGGRTTTFDYDANNNLVRTTDPLGRTVSLTRDALDRVSVSENARGSKVGLAYDPDGRVVSKSYDGVEVCAYEYEAAGNLSGVTDAAGTTRLRHDLTGRVTSICYPDAREVCFSYDEAGNVNAVTYPSGLVVTYGHDSRNRVAQVVWGENSLSCRYDGAGNLVGESRSNGTESAYVYNANNQVVEIKHQKGREALARMTYARDAMGNITEQSGKLPVEPVLLAEDVPTTYNDVNQIFTRGEDRYTYDADGNLIEISGGKWRAEYDPESRPVAVTRDGMTCRYTYNGLGLRTGVETGGSTRHYHHDLEGRVLFETDDRGNVVANYIYGGRHLVARVGASGEVHFYHHDKTGSILALTDEKGEADAAYAYSPSGAIVGKTGNMYNPFTYVGAYGVMDDGDGLFFMRNRYYDATTARFVQKDPLGFVGGTNLYCYTNNNPIRYIDPLGYQAEMGDPTTMAGLGIAGVGGLLWAAGATIVISGTTIAVGPVVVVIGGIIAFYGMATTDVKGKGEKVGAKVQNDIANRYTHKGPDGRYRIDPDMRHGMSDEQIRRWQRYCNDKNQSKVDCDPP
ncbi:MAG: RHS repeat-associated core domain-containing protein [Dehalococcoidia bacterium]